MLQPGHGELPNFPFVSSSNEARDSFEVETRAAQTVLDFARTERMVCF
jgi:hypothetical protein